MVLRSGDMSCSSKVEVKVVLQWHGFNAGDLCLFKNLSVCDKVTPANVEEGAEAARMKALEETYVTAVGDPIPEP